LTKVEVTVIEPELPGATVIPSRFDELPELLSRKSKLIGGKPKFAVIVPGPLSVAVLIGFNPEHEMLLVQLQPAKGAFARVLAQIVFAPKLLLSKVCPLV
jgi:hypothetical protein